MQRSANPRRHPSRLRRQLTRAAVTLLVLGTLSLGSASALAQPSDDEASTPPQPPSFVPPPPPNFTPPPPPSGPPPGAPPRSSTPPRQMPAQDRPAPAAMDPSVREVREQANMSTESSALVNQEDPRMRETVGLIRIPDMGTNEVLEMLENFTNKPILRQQSLPAVKITFFSQGALTRGEAVMAIESLLALNGIAITEVGEKFLKAVPAAIVNQQVAPQWIGTTLNATPSQKIYEKIFELDFLTATEAAPLIQPLLSQGAPIAFDKSNMLLISDALVNLQRLERLLKVLDKPSKLNTEILFYQLENIGSEDALRRLQQIQQGPLKRQLENNTTFDADERTNQLVVFTHPGNKELINSLVEKMDVNVAPLTRTKVYNIRYADAVELVDIIEQVVTGQKEVRDQTAGSNNPAQNAAQAAAARRRAAQVAQQNQAAAAVRAESPNLQFSDFLTIVPDERANTIVASGTENDLAFLEQLIDEIDTILAQVRIEVIIVEVRLTNARQRGIDSFNFAYNVNIGIDDDGGNNSELGSSGSQKLASTGDFYGISIPYVTWGPDGFGVEAIIGAAETESDVRILSAPTIVTTHNKEATVSVGEERPVITSVTSSLDSDNTRETVQFKDIKLELKVTPLIGSDDTVQMEIDQLVQNVVENVLVNGNEQPVVGTRQATSYVSVRDGDVIILGGLQRNEPNVTTGRMAILGYIPLIGDLFTREVESDRQSELMLFIRPTILRDTAEAAAETLRQLNRADSFRYDVETYLDRGSFPTVEERQEEMGKDETGITTNKPTGQRPGKFQK